MAASWTSEQFPQFEESIRALTEDHRELEDEPLHLAISYGPPRDQEDIFLLEVASGLQSIPQDQDLFEIILKSVPGFDTGFSQPLHLILTNPQEFKKALAEGWPLVKELVSTVGAGAYKVLYKDAVGDRLLRQIRAAAKRHAEVSRG